MASGSGYELDHSEVSAGFAHQDQHESAESQILSLLKNSFKPLSLFNDLNRIVNDVVNVNAVDIKGNSPLTYLILQINRGLRYHRFSIPEVKRLEDLHAPKEEIEKKCIEIDAMYQEQVRQCILLLLSKGTRCDVMPGTCPAVPHCSEWNESFEHKIMQSEQRWNLLGFGTSMEFSTYNIFNPLTNYKVENTSGLNVFHLAAWRGESYYLKLLLERGVGVNTVTRDGRNALHLLYIYCNRPADLVASTTVLIDAGIDVNSSDSAGLSPLMVLLYHIITKKTHVKYLANAYSKDYVVDDPSLDNIHVEIKQCVKLLLKAGANINHKNVMGETPLHVIYKRFEHSLEGCEDEFQIRSHYLVPYQFRVTPLTEFSHFLIRHGSDANSKTWYEKSPLHYLTVAIRHLSLSEVLNPKCDILACYETLLENNAAVNSQDCSKATVLHLLVKTITLHRNSLHRYEPVIEALLRHKLNVNIQDKGGNTAIHNLLGSFQGSTRAGEIMPLLIMLFRAGGDASIPNTAFQYPLNNLMKQHVYHHDPLHYGGVRADLKEYLQLMDVVCHTMTHSSLNHVITAYRSSGFCGLVCEEKCDVYALLCSHYSETRSLKHICRLVIWKTMGAHFYSAYRHLPLPTELKKYLYHIGTGY